MFKNKYGELRCGWVLLILVVTIIVIQVFSSLLVTVIFLLVANLPGISTGITDFLDSYINMLMLLVSYITSILGILLLFKIIYKRPFHQLGLSTKHWLSELIYGCLAGIIMIGIVFALLLLTGQAVIESIHIGVISKIDFLFVFLQFILVGFFEEILGRGFIMTAFKTTRNKFLIFTCSSVIFSLAHIANPGVTALSLINIFIVGMLFALMFIKTGKLWLPIGAHITWNFFQGSIFGINVSGIDTISVINTKFVGLDWVTGGNFGAEGGVVTTIVLLSSFAYIFFIMKPKEPLKWSVNSGLPFQ